MSNVNRVVNEIQILLKENIPKLTDAQRKRMYNIINPFNGVIKIIIKGNFGIILSFQFHLIYNKDKSVTNELL